jgi:nucleotide-binding universal stress UspA family protein
MPAERPAFHHVLVAVDGSPHSDLALASAIALAQRDHARLTVMSVAVTVGAAAWSGAVSAPDLQDEVDRGTEKSLRAAVDAVPDDLPVSSVLVHGHPGQAIVEQVRNGRHDAVVLGARGVGRMGAAFGSVSQYVLHHVDVAVFVAHAPRAAED